MPGTSDEERRHGASGEMDAETMGALKATRPLERLMTTTAQTLEMERDERQLNPAGRLEEPLAPSMKTDMKTA